MWDGSPIRGIWGNKRFNSTAIAHIGELRYFVSCAFEKPRWIAPNFLIPDPWRRSKAPTQRAKSGFTGFFTNTGTSTPFKASAKSCTLNGLTVVRAPIHKTSTPYFKANSMCSGVATSIAKGNPVSFFASTNHFKAGSPIPSKLPGRVRGFQTPALMMWA